MTGRPTSQELQRQLLECRQVIETLSTDADWHVTTRAALPYALSGLATRAAYVVLVKLPLSAPAPAVRRAAHLRAACCLVRARWSENELLFVLSEHPIAFCAALRAVLKNEGLNVIPSWSVYRADLSISVADCYRNAASTFSLPKEGSHE